MLARTVVGLVLAVLIAPAVSAQGASCINAFQPVASLNDEGAVVLELQALRNDCFGKGQLTGWEVSADGRLFEPVTTSSLLNNQQADGARLQANTNAAGLYMFRPVFDFGAGPQPGTQVPISVAAAGRSKIAALRLPKMTAPEAAPTKVAIAGITDPEEEAAPFSNTKKAMAESRAAQTGAHVVNGDIAGGGGMGSYNSGGYAAPETSTTVNNANGCANGTLVNGVCTTSPVPSSGVCNEMYKLVMPSLATQMAPASVILGATKVTTCPTASATPTFEVSTDNKTYSDIATQSYVTSYDSKPVNNVQTATFSITTAGKYYLHLRYVLATGRVVFDGPLTITVTAPIGAGPPPAPGNLPGYVGGKLEASQGTVTDAVALTWNSAPAGYTYNVYRWDTTAVPPAYVKLNESPITDIKYSDASDSIKPRQYVVRSVDTAGVESSNSLPATGYANLAPTATEAALDAYMNKTSAQFSVKVADPNFAGGQVEAFQITILTQPPAGEGTASAVGNGLVWQPPSDFSFIGNTSFTYRLRDKGGATVDGTAQVSVTRPPAPAPTGFKVSQGEHTDSIRFEWKDLTGFNEYIATGYNVYNVDTVPPTKLNSAPVTCCSPQPGIKVWSYATTSYEAHNYVVRAITTVGESLPSVVLPGYANAPITAVSVPTIIATAITASEPTPIAVVDQNTALGQSETYAVAIVSQPSAGKAIVTGNGRLQWQPPKEMNFYGTTTFSFSVEDKGKSSMIGTATVKVAPPATLAIKSAGVSAPAAAPKFDAAAEATAYACAKKFSLLQPAVANKSTPLSVQLTLMKNADVVCAGSALDVVFEVSTDNKSYLPLLTAPFVSEAQVGGDSATNQANLVLPSRGLYYFRVQAITASRSVVVGPVKVVAP